MTNIDKTNKRNFRVIKSCRDSDFFIRDISDEFYLGRSCNVYTFDGSIEYFPTKEEADEMISRYEMQFVIENKTVSDSPKVVTDNGTVLFQCELPNMITTTTTTHLVVMARPIYAKNRMRIQSSMEFVVVSSDKLDVHTVGYAKETIKHPKDDDAPIATVKKLFSQMMHDFHLDKEHRTIAWEKINKYFDYAKFLQYYNFNKVYDKLDSITLSHLQSEMS